MRLLSLRGMLTDTFERGNTRRVLTRGEFAELLVEPLQRVIALVAEQDQPGTTPEQRRRADLAYQALSKLSETELTELLSVTNELRENFRDVVEVLSPGLTARADAALKKLATPRYRIWMTPATPATSGASTSVHTVFTPTENVNFRTPLPWVPAPPGTRSALPMLGSSLPTEYVTTRPATSYEWAVDVAFRDWRLYGSTATMPGAVATDLLKPDASRRGVLGLQVNLGQIKSLGITGIFELHIMRTGDPTNPNINHGEVGGIGISW